MHRAKCKRTISYNFINKLAEKLATVECNDLKIPVVFNTTANTLQPNQTVKELLTRQVMSSVYLEDSINFMIEQGVDTFVEIGPGKVLSGFVKKISKDVKIFAVEDDESLQNLLESLKV